MTRPNTLLTHPALVPSIDHWFHDRCEIERETEPTFDPATGQTTPGTPTVLYTDVHCRFRVERDPREPEFGQTRRTIRFGTWLGPITVTGLRRDDVVRITSARDPDAVGRWRVVGVETGGSGVLRKLICRDEP